MRLPWQRKRIAALFKARSDQVERVGVTLQIPFIREMRELVESSQTLNSFIADLDLEETHASRVSVAAKRLARGDFRGFADFHVPGLGRRKLDDVIACLGMSKTPNGTHLLREEQDASRTVS